MDISREQKEGQVIGGMETRTSMTIQDELKKARKRLRYPDLLKIGLTRGTFVDALCSLGSTDDDDIYETILD